MAILDRKAIRDLSHWRGQIVAIALVVACGIACFVTMSSTYHSLLLSQSAYYNQYRFADVFMQLKRAPNAIAPKIEAIPGVQQVQTRVVMDVTLDIPDLPEPATGRLISIPEQPTPMLNDLFLRQGRYIQPDRHDEILISDAFAQANNLQIGDSLGAVINGRWQQLRIVGTALSPEYIYEIRGAGDILPDNEHFGVMWMGRDTLATAFDLDGAFNDLSLTLTPNAIEADVIFQLDRLLNPYGGLGAYDRDDQISNRFISDEIAELETTATVVPAIFLGIAAFLLNILLSRLIRTQRDQIAVLKAFGYANLTVGLHYLKFVLVIVALGTLLGTGIGLWFGSSITHYYGNFFQFPVLRYEAGVDLMLIAILISSGAAVLGAFVAVREVMTLPPAVAMQPAPPAEYRPTLLERFGVQQALSPVARMIVRNLERKPIQAGLSTLGIGLAVAMLIVGRFFVDSVDYLMVFQFQQVQRDDLTLVFNEARPGEVRYDVAHLPGVLRVEPFRTVPARLRFEHRSHRGGILGLDPDGELRQILNRDLQAVDLPSQGVILTQKLAEILGVEPGDRLTVEVMEQDRPTRTVPVAGTVDELMDLSAYMDIHALNRLMREEDTVSGAFVRVDPVYQDALYSLLKRTPAVSAVTVRKFAIARFQKTIGETMGILTNVMILFASVIAFGVVYNASRIALSERGRELATLRIIGFSQAQVAVILLGEQALITLAAMPLGAFLGYELSAVLTEALSREIFRMPLVITRESYVFAFGVVAITALMSGAMIRRQLNQLDLIAVLKTRE